MDIFGIVKRGASKDYFRPSPIDYAIYLANCSEENDSSELHD